MNFYKCDEIMDEFLDEVLGGEKILMNFYNCDEIIDEILMKFWIKL